MPASYPSSIKTFTTKVDSVDYPQAEHVNSLQDEVNAIETELGTNPRSIDDTVAPGATPTSVAAYLDMIANQLKAITGKANWYTAPVRSLESAETTFLKLAGGTMTGAILFSPDASVDIGAVGATRPRDVHVGRDIYVATSLRGPGTVASAGPIRLANATAINWRNAGNTADRGIQLNASDVLASDVAILLPGDPTAALHAATKQYIDNKRYVKLLTRVSTDVVVNNTTAETTVFSYSVPSGTLGTDKALRLVVIGEVLNSTGTARTVTWRGKYGGTQFAGCSLATIALSTNRLIVAIVATIHADGATNAQTAIMQVWVGSTTGVTGGDSAQTYASVAGQGHAISGHTSLAIDSTLAQNLDVTVQLGGAASTVLEYALRSAYLEVLDG